MVHRSRSLGCDNLVHPLAQRILRHTPRENLIANLVESVTNGHDKIIGELLGESAQHAAAVHRARAEDQPNSASE
jgi:hypothetical protein